MTVLASRDDRFPTGHLGETVMCCLRSLAGARSPVGSPTATGRLWSRRRRLLRGVGEAEDFDLGGSHPQRRIIRSLKFWYL